MIDRRRLLAVLALSPMAARAQTQAEPDRAVADKASGRLRLYAGETVLLDFPASFGLRPGPKSRQGDWKTPEGDYMLMPARSSPTWRWFLPITYPNPADLALNRAQGIPDREAGGSIGIHGAGAQAKRHGAGGNWTSGCIAVSNAEIEVLRRAVTRPIPITILPAS
ncbi:MAG: L,D-transpeptidase [Alphaproteobacteria bacterium]|nr:L,D-transpeptidase [Alphaproteobacteria bacterium]